MSGSGSLESPRTTLIVIGISGSLQSTTPKETDTLPITGTLISKVSTLRLSILSVPPNECIGSAWEYDETTDEYYLCLFCKQQPDLNWENPAVRKQVHDVMRFWLDRGADGFRMDVINFVSKDQAFPDSDKTVLRGHEFYACGPRCHEFLKEIGAILQEYDAFSVGEMPCVHDERELIKAVRGDRGELSMIFHFEL